MSSIEMNLSSSPQLRPTRGVVVVGFPGASGPAPLAALALGAPNAFSSPTTSRLRSKLRGISVDESAYYASLGGGSAGVAGDGAEEAAAAVMGAASSDAAAAPASPGFVAASAAADQVPLMSIVSEDGSSAAAASSVASGLKRRRATSVSFTASLSRPGSALSGGAGDAPRSIVVIGLQSVKRGLALPDELRVAAEAATALPAAAAVEAAVPQPQRKKVRKSDASSSAAAVNAAAPPQLEGVAPPWEVFKDLMGQAADKAVHKPDPEV